MKRVNNAILIICTLIMMLFIYAAMAKLLDYSSFRFSLTEAPFIAPFASLLAWSIPGSELLISILLIVPAYRLAGLYSSFLLLLLFTVYIAAMLMIGADMPCSCGGVLEQLSWPAHVVFNSLYTLLAACGILLIRRKRRRQQVSPVFIE